MKNPPHPGRSIGHDCLEPLGLTVAAAARHLGVSRSHLAAVINGEAGISANLPIRLDKAFCGGAHTWHRLQSAQDLAQALRTADRT